MSLTTAFDGVSALQHDADLPEPIERHQLFTYYAIDLDQVAYWCGMDKGRLSLDSPLLSLKLRQSMKNMVQKIHWTLLPTPETLRAIYEFQKHNGTCSMLKRKRLLDVLPVQEYEYFLISCHPKSPPLRITLSDGSIMEATRDDPSDSLPLVRSFAHPYFMLYEFRGELVISSNRPVFPQALASLFREINALWKEDIPYDSLQAWRRWSTFSHDRAPSSHLPRYDDDSTDSEDSYCPFVDEEDGSGRSPPELIADISESKSEDRHSRELSPSNWDPTIASWLEEVAEPEDASESKISSSPQKPTTETIRIVGSDPAWLEESEEGKLYSIWYQKVLRRERLHESPTKD